MSDITFKTLGGEGPDLVLIHGFGSDRLSWAGNSPALMEVARVHSLDLPGHGDSLGAEVGDGSPLALAELPRGAAQIADGLGSMPLTERLVTVFGARLEQLDAGVRADLLRAALDGITGDLSTSTQARYVMGDVQPALAAGLLVVNPMGDIVFRHPLVRTAVVHQAGPQARREAHRNLAGLYDDVLVRRATHLAEASTGPDENVADLLAEARQEAARLAPLNKTDRR